MGQISVIDMKATGNNIDRYRRLKELTVKEVQEQFGFSTPQAVYKWINGISLPSVDNLVVLADLFEVRVDDLLVRKKIAFGYPVSDREIELVKLCKGKNDGKVFHRYDRETDTEYFDLDGDSAFRYTGHEVG